MHELGKVCPRCRKLHARAAGRYCLGCHAAYMREWRKTHPPSLEARKRDNVRSYAHTYKRRGKLTPGPCAKCGDAASQMHHPDYDQPLLVLWLCRACHLALHAEERRNNVSLT